MFVYSRLYETQQTVEALQRNYLAAESELYIFSDGAKNENTCSNVNSVRQYISSISGFKSIKIIESPANKGLADSIICGISHLLSSYEKVIVLEDDLVTTPNFLNFMNQALDFYQYDQNIQSISGYSLALKNRTNSIYFQCRPGSWGWATWKNRWNPDIFIKEDLKFEIHSNRNALIKFKLKCGNDMPKMLLDSINNKNDSWYVRWAFSHCRDNHFAVYPDRSFVQNIGHSIEATNCKGINTYRSLPVDTNLKLFHFTTFKIPEKSERHDFLHYFTRSYKAFFRIKMLITKSGRKQVKEEIKTRISQFYKRM